MSAVLAVDGLVKHFPILRGVLRRPVAWVRAVDGVSFAIEPGETLCLVGESGCGKSTVARLVLRLDEPTGGTIRLDGTDVTALDEKAFAPFRKRVQMVFQDPYASLNPRLKVGQIVGEPLENYEGLSGKALEERVAGLLAKVGLRQEGVGRYPFEFSGGQRQRIGLARALALNPRLIVADEPVSALDVSIRAQILDLFADLGGRLGVAYLFITHDLTVARAITDEVMVMHDGRIVEHGGTKDVLDRPQSDAAKALVAAAPDLERALARRRRERS